MKSLYYVSAQPATLYYAWQVEVMVNNFLKNGVHPEHIHILGAINNNVIPAEWGKLRAHYPAVGFFFYNDTRNHPVYVSSIRPNILKQHFTQHSYLTKNAVFYHDCDMVLTHPITWEQFLDDDVWYLSDTVGYIGAKYIKSKEHGIYQRMCEIIGLDSSVPENNEMHSGGAQYIMKNVDVNYWKKVENDCEALYRYFGEHLKEHPQTPEYHPIQMWTADMWAVLWNGWYFNHNVQVVEEMEFTWPGQPINEWNKKHIFHNAGVTCISETERLFYKGMYMNRLPYLDNFEWVQEDRCSFKYIQEIMETAKVSCLV